MVRSYIDHNFGSMRGSKQGANLDLGMTGGVRQYESKEESQCREWGGDKTKANLVHTRCLIIHHKDTLICSNGFKMGSQEK